MEKRVISNPSDKILLKIQERRFRRIQGRNPTNKIRQASNNTEIGRVSNDCFQLLHNSTIDSNICTFVIDTGIDVSILNSKLVQPEQ